MIQQWDAHKKQLRRYVAKQVDQQSLVDDIVQDVYLKAHTNSHTLNAEDSITGWLYRIAHNTLMDYFRQQQTYTELPDTLESPTEDEAEQAHQALALCLLPLVNTLPEKYSVPLTLSDLDGLPQKQVAEQLGLSLSGAKSRIQRGREKLREQFTLCCDIEVGRGGVTGYQPKKTGCKGC